MVRRAILLSLVYISLSLLLFFCILPESIQLELGQASPRYIGAPRTVEDRYTTQQLREQAKESVKDIFEQDPSVATASCAQVTEIFAQLTSISSQDMKMDAKMEMLQEALPTTIDEAVLKAVLNQSPETNQRLENMLNALLEQAYARGIKAEALATAQEQLQREIDRLYLTSAQRSFLGQVANAVLKPNMLHNAESTERLRQEAVARVLPVTVQKGQKIIGQGEIATEREIMLLSDLGLLRPGINWPLAVGSFVYVAVALLPMALYVLLFQRAAWQDSQQLLLLGLILLLIGALSKLFSTISGLMMPVAAATILIAVLVDPKLAMVSSVTMALVAGR